MANELIRENQLRLLKAFAGVAGGFALAGGTALELYYLKHRFSKDLDFFSPKYDLDNINKIIKAFEKTMGKSIKLEQEFIVSQRAKVRFYSVGLKGTDMPLKLDFVQEVFFDKPKIKRFDHVPVYDVKNIYFQKILTLSGSWMAEDEIGRQISTGRRAARDIIDIYYLSKKVKALHKFMAGIERQYQRGLVQWYRSYSRQELKLETRDLDIYDKGLDVSELIKYLDEEMKIFIREVLE